jgi:hypothetical protein
LAASYTALMTGYIADRTTDLPSRGSKWRGHRREWRGNRIVHAKEVMMLRTMMGFCLVFLGAEEGERLPGNKVSIEEAVGRAQIIVGAEVESLGVMDPGPAGSGRYSGLKLKPSKSLKGGTGSRELTLEDLKFRTFPKEVAETLLEKGTEYLFFIEQPSPETTTTQYWGIKVLRATKENLDAVADAQRREVRWPGSWRNLNDAARDAQLVVVAKLVELGKSHDGPAGCKSYGPEKIEVSRSLKGETNGPLSPTFHVVVGPPESVERVPVPGQEYVMFIELRDGVTPHILRMMPATKENIEAAKDALRRLHQHVAKNPMTVRQVKEEINQEVPGGSTRKHAENWLISHGFEYSYSKDAGAWSEISRNEPDLSKYSGAIVSIIRDTDRKMPLVSGNIQVYTPFDKKGEVAKHRVVWVGTGP